MLSTLKEKFVFRPIYLTRWFKRRILRILQSNVSLIKTTVIQTYGDCSRICDDFLKLTNATTIITFRILLNGIKGGN